MDIMNIYNSITDIDLQFNNIQNPRSCMDIHDSIMDIQNGMLKKIDIHNWIVGVNIIIRLWISILSWIIYLN